MFNQPVNPDLTPLEAREDDTFIPSHRDGHLILFLAVHETRKVQDEQRGECEAAIVDFVDLDEGMVGRKARVVHIGFRNKLPVGAAMVLGRVASVPTKRGTNAWVLERFTPGVDDVKAGQWVEANQHVINGGPALTPVRTAPTPVAGNKADELLNKLRGGGIGASAAPF